jgi:hypothetical protein
VFTPGVRQHVSRPLSRVGAAGIELIDSFIKLESVADITKCLHVWTDELQNDVDREFLLAGVSEGFHVIDSTELPHEMTRSNYNSTAGVNKLQVEKRIQEELSKGNYVLCEQKPLVCSALGVVPKGG